MSNENNLSTAGRATQTKQPWTTPAIEVLDLNAARNIGTFTRKDSQNRS
jgi:hypothetical protein